MTYDSLVAGLSGPIEPAKAMRLYADSIRSGGYYLQVMELARGSGNKERDRAAFHAGWALEYAYFDDRDAFAPYIEEFLADFTEVTNSSVHRHYTKMLYDMICCGTVKLEGEQAEKVAEVCFDFLIDPKTKVAVKAWAMDILSYLAPRIDWVGENLREILIRVMEDGSPGIQNKGRKMLKILATSGAKG